MTSVALALLPPSRRRSVFSSSDPPAVVSTTSSEKPAADTPSRSSSSARRRRTRTRRAAAPARAVGERIAELEGRHSRAIVGLAPDGRPRAGRPRIVGPCLATARRQRAVLPSLEQQVLERWRERDVFHESIRRREGAPPFVFYEGPPTANGRPGSHHVLPRVFKDVFPRYKTMRGHLVHRKGGWDCHGLPVELEIEKELGFKSKEDIERYGVAEFNAAAASRCCATSTSGTS